MARTTGPRGRTVTAKALAVLGSFGADRPSLSLSDIARRADLPVSTARRLIGELAAWGALERTQDGSYRVGMRLWEVGSLAPRPRDLRDAARPFLQDLHDAARQNVQLVVLDGVEAVCVERVHGPRSVRTEIDVGDRLALHATAAGKALLAFSPPDLLREVEAAGLERFTVDTIVEVEALAVELRRIQQEGLASSVGERAAGAAGVAAPILGVDRHAIGAISIVAPIGTDLARLGPAVRAAAITVSRVVA